MIKKCALSLGLCLCFQVGFTQIFVPEGVHETSGNDNVGIHISDPEAVLHIKSTVSDGSLRLDAIQAEGPGETVLETPYLINGTLRNLDLGTTNTTFMVKPNGQAFLGSNLNTWSNATSLVNLKTNLAIFSTNDEFLKLDYTSTVRGASIIWSNTASSSKRSLNFRYGSNTASPFFTIAENGLIGISTADPQTRLHISTTTQSAGLRVDAVSATGPGETTLTTPFILKGTLTNDLGTTNTSFLVKSDGKTFIGNNLENWSNATSYLNTQANLSVLYSNDEFLRLDYTNPLRGASLVWSNTASSSEQNLNFRFGSNTAEPLFTLSPEGIVGIGATEFNGDYQLYVAGKVLCTELTVKLEQDWPDFVFDQGYERPSLHEIELFIKENGHLPGVPSAEEVKANGVNTGEMQAILLQKIEELTLELIEVKKELSNLKGKP